MSSKYDNAVEAAACLSCLGYTGWRLTCLIYGIQALTDHGASHCSTGSFKWLWFIVVSSALFAWDTFLKSTNTTSFNSEAEFAYYIVLSWVFALSFAIATQYQYLDGCGGKAHETMFIYMWGNYVVAAGITLCGACAAMGSVLAKRKAKQAAQAATQAVTCNM